MFWLKRGTPVMLATLTVATVLLVVFFDNYRGS
jgi:hypothetical protein